MGKTIDKRYSYSMLIPGCLLFALFFIVPTISGIYYSFRNWDGFTSNYVGIDNFITFLTNRELNVSFKHTFIFAAVTTVFKVLFGLILAVFLNQKLKATNYLRTVFFMPAIINTVAVGLTFTAVLHPETGILNRFLRFIDLGFLAQNWLTDTKLAIFSVSAIEIWKWTGFTMTILLAGLQTIPEEYNEAADIDGATNFERFRYITLPLLMPQLNNAVILSVIGGLKVFDIIQVTTQGGPGNATQVINTVIFRSFAQGYYGEASAGNLVLGIIVAAIAVLTYSILSKKEVEV